MPISPPRASPVSNCGIGTAKVVNRAGSRVISAAAAATGITAQPSSAAAPPSTTTVCASPASCSAEHQEPRDGEPYESQRIQHADAEAHQLPGAAPDTVAQQGQLEP